MDVHYHADMIAFYAAQLAARVILVLAHGPNRGSRSPRPGGGPRPASGARRRAAEDLLPWPRGFISPQDIRTDRVFVEAFGSYQPEAAARRIVQMLQDHLEGHPEAVGTGWPLFMFRQYYEAAALAEQETEAFLLLDRPVSGFGQLVDMGMIVSLDGQRLAFPLDDSALLQVTDEFILRCYAGSRRLWNYLAWLFCILELARSGKFDWETARRVPKPAKAPTPAQLAIRGSIDPLCPSGECFGECDPESHGG